MSRLTFLEPPPVGEKIPERLAGCTYELHHFPDLSNLFLMALLKENGFEIDLIDANLEGLGETEFTSRLENDNSDYYVLHSVILSKPTDLYWMEKIYRLKAEGRILLHGPEPTRVPEAFLQDKRTVVFRGEPENNLLAFLKQGKAPGISYLTEGGEVESIPPSQELVNLDQLPIPLRDFGPLAKYRDRFFNPKFRGRPHTAALFSRGCAFRCLFCVPISLSFSRELEYKKYFNKKPPVAIASAPRVITEFRDIAEKGYRSLMILDDQFLWGKERTLEICQGVKDLGLEWGILSRADFLTDPDIAKALKTAGCRVVDIGVESLSQPVLDFVRKDLKVETVEAALENLKRHKIEAKLNIILGACPMETAAQAREGIEKLNRLPVEDVMFSIATPFKGTEFYHYCQEKGYLIDESDAINPLKKSMVSYPHMDNRELENLEKYAYRSFYLRPKQMLKRLKKIGSFKELLNNIKLAMELFK